MSCGSYAGDMSDYLDYLEYAFEPMSPVEQRTDPLILETNFILEGFNDFQPIAMDFEMDLSINMTWELRRSICEKYMETLARDGVNTSSDGIMVIPPRRLTKNIYWLPDIFLVEAKSAASSSDVIYTTNGKFLQSRKCTESRMIVLSKQKLVVACQLDLHRFPFDEHTCPLTIRSFSHGNATLRMVKSTRVPNVLRFGNNRLQEFSFRADVIEVQNDLSWFEPYAAYSSMRIDISFKRKMLNVILTAFFPCSAIVFVAMLAYLMDVNSTYERVVLTMTTLLTQYTLITLVRSFLPPTSYMTRVDVFMYTCLFINTVMVVECALIDKINVAEKEHLITKPEQIGFELDTKTTEPGKNNGKERRGKNKTGLADAGTHHESIPSNSLRVSAIPADSDASPTISGRISQTSALRQRLPATPYGKKKNRVNPTPRLITPWSTSAGLQPRESALGFAAAENSVCADQLFQNIKGPKAERIDRVFKIALLFSFLGFQVGFWAVHLNFMAGAQVLPSVIV